MSKGNLGFDSKVVHSGGYEDPLGSATTPIYQSSTFKFRNAEEGARCFTGESEGYIYTRISNPTIKELENAMADLENGYGGIATSSGMGAINTLYMAYLEQGAHIVSHEAVYGPARVVLEKNWARFGVEATFVDTADLEAVKAAIRPNTRLLYTETPANPTIGISDLSALAEIAHNSGIPFAVDNTFCSPYLQKPLDLGADIVIHSMTKFINGHADIVAGMLVAKNKDDYNKLRSIMVNLGCNMDPSQAYMVRRGLKTLSIRIEKAQKSAMRVAEYLERHPKIEWVKYPGLHSHPDFELAQSQMSGSGSMMSFEVKGGLQAGKILMDNVRLALLAVSLGGVETLIQHPASMTHSKMTAESKQTAGITDGLVRLSIGIEDVDDLISDLDQALAVV